MYTRQAFLLGIFACLAACGGNTAAQPAPATPAAPVAPPDPPPAHQSEEKPKLPSNGGEAKTTKVHFDMPDTWSQAPQQMVRKPWKIGVLNRELKALVLVDYETNPRANALQTTGRLISVLCKDDWSCQPSKQLAGGHGATFTFTDAGQGIKGKIAVRDLNGPGQRQVQLYGRWAQENDAQASKDFDQMVSTISAE